MKSCVEVTSSEVAEGQGDGPLQIGMSDTACPSIVAGGSRDRNMRAKGKSKRKER